MADGQTNAQIAARLHVSESTVEKHVSRVLAKLGLSTRAGVVRLLAHERAALGLTPIASAASARWRTGGWG